MKVKAIARMSRMLGLLLSVPLVLTAPQRAQSAIETPNLVIHDATGRLSEAQVRRLSNQAEQYLEKIFEFWSANSRIEQFGKIRISLDHPRIDRSGRAVKTAVFHWRKIDGRNTRMVSVFGVDGEPYMMAQKINHAVFPNPDKLIRNMMGIPVETRFGNPLSFPTCGFSSDAWVLALRQIKAYMPLAKLGPEHEDWGMSTRAGLPIITNKAKQHAAYAEAGSLGEYLLSTYGAEKVRAFYRLSHTKPRPWLEIFGLPADALERDWNRALDAAQTREEKNTQVLVRLLKQDRDEACSQAQRLAIKAGRKSQ